MLALDTMSAELVQRNSAVSARLACFACACLQLLQQRRISELEDQQRVLWERLTQAHEELARAQHVSTTPAVVTTERPVVPSTARSVTDSRDEVSY